MKNYKPLNTITQIGQCEDLEVLRLNCLAFRTALGKAVQIIAHMRLASDFFDAGINDKDIESDTGLTLMGYAIHILEGGEA